MERKLKYWIDGGSLIIEERVAYTSPGRRNRRWAESRVEVTVAELAKINQFMLTKRNDYRVTTGESD